MENGQKEEKTFGIEKKQVWDAYYKVKYNLEETPSQELEASSETMQKKLDRLWMLMNTGRYVPKPVKLQYIPKESGGQRTLGIPTFMDRVAQTVVASQVTPIWDQFFHVNSYAYRPRRSAWDAVAKAMKNCREYDWVLDMDIKSFFDTIDHTLLMRAVEKHVSEEWILLYIQKWITVPYVTVNKKFINRTRGVPQGSVIGPILANLFLHYAFDQWMAINHPGIPFERYADDVICHCQSEKQAVSLKEDLMERFRECKLKLNLKKTKIVYCQDSKRREKYENLSFDYLGFTFISRGNTAEKHKARTKEFMPAVSKKSIKKLKDAIHSWNLNRKTFYSIEKLSREINPRIQGWMNYYGKPHQEELWKAMRFMNEKLARWAQHKFQSYYRDFPLEAAYEWLEFQSVENEALFAHWVEGFKPVRKIQRSYREHYAEIFVMEKSKDYEDNMDDYFGIYFEDLFDF